MRLLFRTVKLEHALRLLPRDLHGVMRSRARLGVVDYLNVYYELTEERLARVFAASGPIDGRGAGEFVYRALTPAEIARAFPGQARAISEAMRTSWERAA